MKKVLFPIVIALFIVTSAYSQPTMLPPELKWWLDEVQKGNPAISIDQFRLAKNEVYPIDDSGTTLKTLYPPFCRWSFSGNYLGYFNYGVELSKLPDGKYQVSSDIDLAVLILNKDLIQIFADYDGSSSGINGIAWLRDNILVGVGTSIESQQNENPQVTLVIREYLITNKNIVCTQYEYKNAFLNDVRLKLNLNWIDQRKDYFFKD